MWLNSSQWRDQFSSVTQSCLIFCNPMDCSIPDFPVHYQLLELVQTHVYRVSDAIQLFHPLSSLLLLPLIFPSIRVLSSESVLHIKWPEYWSFNISHSNEYSGLISFAIDWFDLLAVQGTLSSLLQHHSSKRQFFRMEVLLETSSFEEEREYTSRISVVWNANVCVVWLK